MVAIGDLHKMVEMERTLHSGVDIEIHRVVKIRFACGTKRPHLHLGEMDNPIHSGVSWDHSQELLAGKACFAGGSITIWLYKISHGVMRNLSYILCFLRF